MAGVMLETTQQRARAAAQQAAVKRAEEAKDELGRWAFETLEEYFPEQARERSRQNWMRALFVGLALGFLLRWAMRR